MKTMHLVREAFSFLCMAFALMFCFEVNSYAVSAKDIDSGADVALKTLRDIKGGGEVIDQAKGILVFPGVFKGAAGVGAQYGEGAL